MVCTDVVICIFPRAFRQGSYLLQDFRTSCCPSLRMMSSDDLMSLFLGLIDRALVHLFLRPDYIHISSLNQILASSLPYMHDFESLVASASATC